MAWSERIVGGIDKRVASAITNTGRFEPASNKDREARFRGVDLKENVGAAGGRPNVVIVVLESTTGSLVTPSNDAGVSPWAAKLAQRSVSSELLPRAGCVREPRRLRSRTKGERDGG